MSNRTVGLLLLVGGTLVFLLSLLADSIGIDSNVGFGWLQIVGILVGLVAMILGAVRLLRKPATPA